MKRRPRSTYHLFRLLAIILLFSVFALVGTRQIAANSSQEEGSGDSDLAYLLEQDDPAAALREALPRLTGEARRAAEQILRVIETDQSRAGK